MSGKRNTSVKVDFLLLKSATIWTNRSPKSNKTFCASRFTIGSPKRIGNLDGLVVVSEQRVEPEEPHEAEVSHHLVERMPSEFSGHGIRVSAGGVDFQLLVDVALVHHRVEDVQNLSKQIQFRTKSVV